jgi:hypothetical protein
VFLLLCCFSSWGKYQPFWWRLSSSWFFHSSRNGGLAESDRQDEIRRMWQDAHWKKPQESFTFLLFQGVLWGVLLLLELTLTQQSIASGSSLRVCWREIEKATVKIEFSKYLVQSRFLFCWGLVSEDRDVTRRMWQDMHRKQFQESFTFLPSVLGSAVLSSSSWH